MVIVSFIGDSWPDVRRQAQAFLDGGAQGEAVQSAMTTVAISEAGASYAFVAEVLSRIPKERVARAVLRDIADAALRGEAARYHDLRAKHAGGNGQRFAGYLQSITKVSFAIGGRPLIVWDEMAHSWNMSESDARALLELSAAQRT